MEVTRIIHPVGQGGFYTETLREEGTRINVVYDCGGFLPTSGRMNKYLKCFIPKHIEAVFISHFHADHINGLQYLLENAEVNYLFLPQVTENILLETLVHNLFKTNTYSRVNSFIMSLFSGKLRLKGKKTKIIKVSYANVTNNIPKEFPANNSSDNPMSLKAWDTYSNTAVNLSNKDTISAGTILYYKNWLYIPFNSIVPSEKLDELMKAFTSELGGMITMENVAERIKEMGVEKCKKIYGKIFANQHNSYSMTLFSGTLEKALGCRCKGLPECESYHHCDGFDPHRYCCNPNFLYTGDFEPKKNIGCMRNFYDKYWEQIASIQIPHHGSVNNYDPQLYEYPVRGIVSVGNDNIYHHPDIDTLVKIQSEGCRPVIVTEDISSMKIYQYEID